MFRPTFNHLYINYSHQAYNYPTIYKQIRIEEKRVQHPKFHNSKFVSSIVRKGTIAYTRLTNFDFSVKSRRKMCAPC